MKTITICGKEYEIDCNALTYVKYKNFFKTGILKDMQFIQNYLIKQAVVMDQIDDKLDETTKHNEIAEYMIDDIDDFVTKTTQIAWILIYTANNKIESYEEWLKSIEGFKLIMNGLQR